MVDISKQATIEKGLNWTVTTASPRKQLFMLPNGEIVELAADAYHLPRYLSRGFRLVTPGAEKEAQPQEEPELRIEDAQGLIAIRAKPKQNKAKGR